MAFRVEISPEAFGDLDAISSYIQARASAATATRWFNGLFDSIRSLSEMPKRCVIAEESADMKAEIRLLLYGRRNRCYKVYFSIHDASETVRILHVRHWARKPVEADELADLMDEDIGPGIEEDPL